MGFFINKFSGLKENRGAALITVVLMIVLVTALLMMALNISGIEMTLSATNRRTTQTFQAAGAGVEIAPTVIKEILEDNALPTGYPATIVLDNTATGGDAGVVDLIEELATGGGTLSDDAAASNPDLTITALDGQTLRVDIDYEGPATLPGSELDEFSIGYHKKTGGTGCTTGTIYNINVVASGPLSTQSNVGSAYFNCS
ncbi:MAG: pilus assembly PilX N-terminal domain-containing protein [Candidatus Manganitrophus sp. SB1]|nr:pilus assembly PilX N-terminal domain-containing protein [Candidatus Manganitrophus morganii]